MMGQADIYSGEWVEVWGWFNGEPEGLEHMAYISYEEHVDGGKRIFAAWEDAHGGGEAVCDTIEEAQALLTALGFKYLSDDYVGDME